MAEVIDDNFMVCTDCLMVIANADYSGLDYYYSEEEAAQRKEAIDDGIAHTKGHICVGDSEKDNDFSSSWCDCCHTPLAGPRHHCVVLE